MGSSNTKNIEKPRKWHNSHNANISSQNFIKIIPAYKASNVYKSQKEKVFDIKLKIMKRILKECLEKIESSVSKGYCKVRLDDFYSANDTIIKTKHLKKDLKDNVLFILKNQGYDCYIKRYKNRRSNVYSIKISWKYAEYAFENEDDQLECPICFEKVSQKDRLICGHRVHLQCINNISENKPPNFVRMCPICRKVLG